MSCLNLRLPPARKAWKSFTSKIQSKLHKLNKPKAIRKQPKNRLKFKATSTTTSGVARPYKFLELRFQHKRRLVQSTEHLRLLHQRCNTFNKYPDPVYVDKLFKEPVSEHLHPSPVLKITPRTNKPTHDPPTTEASKEDGRCAERTTDGDDMWESMGFASPQMHGINERAEEFITRFRAQMEVQEMLARNL